MMAASITAAQGALLNLELDEDALQSMVGSLCGPCIQTHLPPPWAPLLLLVEHQHHAFALLFCAQKKKNHN